MTLGGGNDYRGGTIVTEGILSISGDQNLGRASGGLTLDGGTLRTTDAFATARSINLGAGGGTLQTDAELMAIGTLAGEGGLTKTGGGTLTLTGANTYQGGTRLNAGVLAVSADANLGEASGALRFNGGGLRTTGAFATARNIDIEAGGGTLQTYSDLAATGIVSGAGALTKTGSATLSLTGENTYSGGTDLKQGRIAVGNDRALGTGELAMHEGTILLFAADGLPTNTACSPATPQARERTGTCAPPAPSFRPARLLHPSRCPPTEPKCLSSQPCPSSCARATSRCSATCTSASATTM